jgi:site-specific DNA-adenine methylase
MTKKLANPDDKISVWGTKQFGGYAGVKHTASRIKQFIPNSMIYVEAFAGMGRTCDENKHHKIILNDMSDFAVKTLQHNFKKSIITQLDFELCVKENDSLDTFFLFDPPWESNIYDGNNNLTYCNMKPSEYYSKLLDIVRTIKGNWIILSSCNKSRYQFKTNYYELIVESELNVLFGRKARTRLTSNKPLIIHNQKQTSITDLFFL